MSSRHTARAGARQARQAFTLMEILIVVAIIVVLAGTFVVYGLPMLKKSEEDSARLKMKGLEAALTQYRTVHKTFPPDLQTLTVQDPEYDNKPYIEDEGIMDPWGQPFQYSPDGSRNKGAKPDIWTTHEGKEIGNWRSK
jgi:general secretion pathway protein G